MHPQGDRRSDGDSNAPLQGSNNSFSLVDAARALHGELARVLDASMCFFGVFDPVKQMVDVVWQVQDGIELPGGAFPLGSGLTSQVIRERRPRLLQNWSRQGPRVETQYATERPELPESVITAPVLRDEQVLGVVSLQSHHAAAFQPRDVDTVQRIVDDAAPRIAALLEAQRTAQGTQRTPLGLNGFVAQARDAALALDHECRLVGLNEAARRLLSLHEHSVLFGFPIDQPQAGHWPLGSSTLTDALRPILHQLRRDDVQPETEITLHSDSTDIIKCSVSRHVESGQLVGAVMTFRSAGPRAA